MKNRLINLITVAFMVILLANVHAAAQSIWLDQNPLPSWSERSRAILQTRRISRGELRRCAVTVRQPTLPQDRLLTGYGWTLVGAAQVFGNTTVVTVAEAFDGMCRPLNFQSLVFVGNRVAGTLSPGQMDSRTDGSLVNTILTTERTLTAEYVRYRASDALCCPYKTEAVTFKINPDGTNFLLVPESKIDIDASGGGSQPSDTTSLTNTVWQWESLQTPVDKVTVNNPENYTLEFMSDGTVQVQADCNRGRGRYTASDDKSISLSAIALTRRACPRGSLDNRFTRSLGAARIFFFQDGALYMDLFADGGTMRFVKSNR